MASRVRRAKSLQTVRSAGRKYHGAFTSGGSGGPTARKGANFEAFRFKRYSIGSKGGLDRKKAATMLKASKKGSFGPTSIGKHIV